MYCLILFLNAKHLYITFRIHMKNQFPIQWWGAHPPHKSWLFPKGFHPSPHWTHRAHQALHQETRPRFCSSCPQDTQYTATSLWPPWAFCQIVISEHVVFKFVHSEGKMPRQEWESHEGVEWDPANCKLRGLVNKSSRCPLPKKIPGLLKCERMLT